MNTQTDSPAAPEKLQTRPEKRFEGRRKFIGLFVIGIVLVGLWFILKAFSNPMGGISEIGKPATPIPSPIRATITVRSIAAPATPVVTPTSTVRPGSAVQTIGTGVNPSTGNLTCWANQDVALDDKLIIPRDAMLRVGGWTAARGGMVEVQGQWVNESAVRCTGDVRVYERPFVMVPTKARSSASGATSNETTRIVYVPITATPGVVTPAATPTPSNGMWFDGAGCWRVNVDYVREIWVNGKGVSNGTYCAVNDIRIVAK
ncbi:MAG: hypothetical protein HY868_16660 [Chloroflexi bacterium]|nr:hypothetical protein [Chloroflexota bacterium]